MGAVMDEVREPLRGQLAVCIDDAAVAVLSVIAYNHTPHSTVLECEFRFGEMALLNRLKHVISCSNCRPKQPYVHKARMVANEERFKRCGMRKNIQIFRSQKLPSQGNPHRFLRAVRNPVLI